jgi:hypothetical protein
VNALEEFLASLRRLFDFRTRPPAEPITAPTSDRPPPKELTLPDEPSEESSLPLEPVRDDVAAIVDAAVTEVPSAPRDAEAVAEVRALLEAMAEASVAAPESGADLPQAVAEPVQAPAPLKEPLVDEQPVPATAPLDEPAAAGPVPDLVGGALVLTLSTPPATFTIARSTATLGRGEDNTIRLDDLSVSRRHARIVYRRAGYWLSDLGSMGGTWVNGSRLAAPHEIEAGEIIDIGHCRLTVSYARDPASGDAKAKTPSRRPARR